MPKENSTDDTPSTSNVTRTTTPEGSRRPHEPWGRFEQGDPLIICGSLREDVILASAHKLKIRGYYTGPGALLTGRRFGKVIFDLGGSREFSHKEFTKLWNWIAQQVATNVFPTDTAEYVFV